MSRGVKGIWAALRKLWLEMDPSLYVESQPTFVPLDESRMEFSFKGERLVFDRQAQTVSRQGRVLARYDAIQCVGIYVKRGSETGMDWKVGLEIGFMRNIGIGSFETGVDASIVAAKISAIIGKKVQTL